MAVSEARTRDERRYEAALELDEAITALEAVEWGGVPGVSAVTAATFTRKLQWAQAALDDGAGVGGP